MKPSTRHVLFTMVLATISQVCWLVVDANAQSPTSDIGPSSQPSSNDFVALQQQYLDSIWPLLQHSCCSCHNDADLQGELSLESYTSLEAVRQQPRIWQNVLAQVESGEMPPKDSEPLSDEQTATLKNWINSYLEAEAMASAGDPGPVVLRRLSNDEYTYSIRDLTGLTNLHPANEFPVDGAAGEGFTNVGSGLVMSPALLSKYLKSAKAIAEHLVLLPDGIGFSEYTSQQDRTDALLREIRSFYQEHTIPGGDTSRNLQGVRFLSQDAGVVNLEPYISATIRYREVFANNADMLSQIASQQQLNHKYLALIWHSLNSEEPSILLDPIRALWKDANLDDSQKIVDEIELWQSRLWQFTTVGHIGKRDGPTSWQESVSPLATSQNIDFLIENADNKDSKDSNLSVPFNIWLTTYTTGDDGVADRARWIQPRLVLQGLPDVSLQAATTVASKATRMRTVEIERTTEYLNALASQRSPGLTLTELAEQQQLSSSILQSWKMLVDLASPTKLQVTGHFKDRLTDVGGFADVRGWGEPGTPSLIANRSTTTYRFSTLTVPGQSVLVHPSPDRQAVVYWRSPVQGKLRIHGMLADADANCGNGVTWAVQHLTTSNSRGQQLAGGQLDNGGSVQFQVEQTVAAQVGDLIRFTVDAGNRDHVCDTTQLNLHIDLAESPKAWDLQEDVATSVEQSNPLKDRYGEDGVWHFCATPVSEDPPQFAFLQTSLLGQWNRAIESGDLRTATDLAKELQRLLVAGTQESGELPENSTPSVSDDGLLAEEILDYRGSMQWLKRAIEQNPDTQTLQDLITQPGNTQVSIPVQFRGASLKSTVVLDQQDNVNGSIQVAVRQEPDDDFERLANTEIARDGQSRTWSDAPGPTNWQTPILVTQGSEKELQLQSQIQSFRSLFPAAMCYLKIVPVDEVVTLTLFYREDDFLKQLMLTESESNQLDQLWQQLHFVSQDALKLVDAFEQLWQYATQDADPSAFEPMRAPIMQRADEFRLALENAETDHVRSLAEFAQKAWRHHHSEQTLVTVQHFYQQLRHEGLDHTEAVKMTLARILVAPEFLYKLEEPSRQTSATAISNRELAQRLSYFLWSSLPDSALEDALIGKSFTTDGERLEVVQAQTKRMLADPKIRRLAEQFGCQWIGVRDFEQFDEKSESQFPEFKQLRVSMAEEAVLFFTDFFQSDRSVLSLLDADHTFIDENLVEFYQLGPFTEDHDQPKNASHWRRAEGMREHGRGGILGLAATLAKQSGASRTSPILRGNWVYETLLGQHLPNPPKNVPVLPEVVPVGLTERELIEMHSSAPECAKCHSKIDGFGFALEGFDAIGKLRPDSDTATQLPDGVQINGLSGLRDYLLNQRREDFTQQFCRKLLGFALGRSVQLSDQPLLDMIAEQLKNNDYRVSVAIETIVTSQQFTHIRGVSDSNE